MATNDITNSGVQQSHVMTLVLNSEEALERGRQLCSIARERSMESAKDAVDVLALAAKVRWLTDAVLEQLKLASSVSKIIEHKRSVLESQAKEWDSVRTQRTSSLDSVLESLGTQLVPAGFYSVSPESSLFGSQHGSDDEAEPENAPQPSVSPTATLRGDLRGLSKALKSKQQDRSMWKSLRDFVDERAIEDVLDAIDSDRNVLDDILARTSDYPESLSGTIGAIKSSLPTKILIPPMDNIFAGQEAASVEMANHLLSLTQHHDQMVQALHDCEAGTDFSEMDLQEMNRDTQELPAIVADLEKNMNIIDMSHDELVAAKRAAQEQLDSHRSILDDLDELGDIMSEMLERQESVENESAEQLTLLHANLVTVEELYHRYTSYQYSYNKLVIELARRQQYHEAAQKIIEGMRSQLEAMTEEERQRREEFNAEHGEHLPDDLCLSIQNPPTCWRVSPQDDELIETLPDIGQDLLRQAFDRVASVESAAATNESASQSL